jgi:hypothetical protein
MALLQLELFMNTRYAGLLTILSLFFVSGCATMSADECTMSDWHTIGFEDGAQGYAADRLGDHRKACAKHGVAPDFEQYQAGRTQGLRQQFCQPSRGFSLGAGGGRYNGVCPADMEMDFVDAYNSGHQLYTLQSAVNSATHQISAKRAELERTDDRIREAEALLIARETTVEDRVLLLAEIKDLAERTGELDAQIVNLIEERAISEQRLASYETILADSGY